MMMMVIPEENDATLYILYLQCIFLRQQESSIWDDSRELVMTSKVYVGEREDASCIDAASADSNLWMGGAYHDC